MRILYIPRKELGKRSNQKRNISCGILTMARAEEMIVSHGRTPEDFDHEGRAGIGIRLGLRARTRAPLRKDQSIWVLSMEACGFASSP
jgi:hypothetical protein